MSKQAWKRPTTTPSEDAPVGELAVFVPPVLSVPDNEVLPTHEHEVTVQAWAAARDTRDVLIKAFVHSHKLVRVTKRSLTAWSALYQEFLTQPRG
jgi:hypothetical protein